LKESIVNSILNLVRESGAAKFKLKALIQVMLNVLISLVKNLISSLLTSPYLMPATISVYIYRGEFYRKLLDYNILQIN